MPEKLLRPCANPHCAKDTRVVINDTSDRIIRVCYISIWFFITLLFYPKSNQWERNPNCQAPITSFESSLSNHCMAIKNST